jgi:hypothetical protein
MRRLLLVAIVAVFSIHVWIGSAAFALPTAERIAPNGSDHAANSLAASKAKTEETVSFNTKTYKYHCITCSAAKRCTKNCIDIALSDAIARGGVACKICGGTCRY